MFQFGTDGVRGCLLSDVEDANLNSILWLHNDAALSHLLLSIRLPVDSTF